MMSDQTNKLVIIGNQRERGGNITRFTDAHERAGEEQLIEGFRVAGEPHDERPDKQTGDNDPAAPRAVGEKTGERTEQTVNPEEHRREQTELRVSHPDGRLRLVER